MTTEKVIALIKGRIKIFEDTAQDLENRDYMSSAWVQRSIARVLREVLAEVSPVEPISDLVMVSVSEGNDWTRPKKKISDLVMFSEGNDWMRPKIVCLCGSTRFGKTFEDANRDETLQGNMIFTIGCTTHSDAELHHCTRCGKSGYRREIVAAPCTEGDPMSTTPLAHNIAAGLSPATKEALDELHKRKIEMSDEILVLNQIACARCKQPPPVEGRPPKGPFYCKATENADGGRTEECVWKPYIGDSTRSEIEHALKLGKKVRFLNPFSDFGDWVHIRPSDHELRSRIMEQCK